MLEAGVHFGHQTRYWNRKMAEYIFGQRSKIHIVNLEKTMQLYTGRDEVHPSAGSEQGHSALRRHQAPGARNRRRGSPPLRMPYVDARWLGGMLTNFKTVKASTKRLKDLEQMHQDGTSRR
jgi:small subunit ribosomal protein S2